MGEHSTAPLKICCYSILDWVCVCVDLLEL